MRNFGKLFFALFAFAMCAAVSAEARSITGVQRRMENGKMFLDVTFDAGETGDNHALYIAYDMEDKGDDIGNWAALQRGCNISVTDTSAEIPVSPLLTEKGYTFCRVFLTTSAAPYDTQLEYLRQSGTQYIDTGIYPNYTSVAVMDVEMLNTSTKQQRFFGVSSDDASAVFSFDCYISGALKLASACQNGKGDWKASTAGATADRLTITLDANTGYHTVSNHVSDAVTRTTRSTTRSATSVASLIVFAQHVVTSTSVTVPESGKSGEKKWAQGARLYSFTMTTNSMVACNYRPCMLGGRAGVYDSVTDTVIYSASGTDFDATNSGSPIACSLLECETQVAVAQSATELLSDYVWGGTSANWGGSNAWTKDDESVTWADGNNAVFDALGATAALDADVMAKRLVFKEDAAVSGSAKLTVPTVQVNPGVTATISAPTAGALEKTGAGTLTLAKNRIDATIVTEGMLKMDGATVAGLTLGTDGGAPVAFDYGGQEIKCRNSLNYLVTGSTVTLTNGVFSTDSESDLNIRNDTFTMPSVLTIAKDAVVRQSAKGKKVYLNYVNGAATINVIGGMLGNIEGCAEVYLQHKSADGRLDINVVDGGLVYFPCTINALCGNNTARTAPALCLTVFNSAFVGGTFNFGTSYSNDSYVPTNPTGVFAATNSVISVGEAFKIGRSVQIDGKTGGRYTADFEDCIVTAKTFAVYYDRPLNNARFNGSRFVFNAAGGNIVASDDGANWFTVGEDGLIIDTQDYSATLNANLGGSGLVTKVGAGTLTVSRNQATDGGFEVEEGVLSVDGVVTFSGAVEFAKDAALDIANYVGGVTPLSAAQLKLPDGDGAVSLTLDGGEFGEGAYVICSVPGVSVADGDKFSVAKADDLLCNWSVDGDKLILTVGQVPDNYWTGLGSDDNMSNPDNWGGGKVPPAGADIDFSGLSGDATIIADAGRAFGAVTMGTGVITFSGDFAAKSFSDTSKIAVAADSTVTIDSDIIITESSQRLCNTVAAGGVLCIKGVLEVAHTSGGYFWFVNREKDAEGAFVVEGGIVVKSTEGVALNAMMLVLGEKGISFTVDGKFAFYLVNSSVRPLGATTVLGTEGKGKFYAKGDNILICTTQYGSDDRPAVITFDGKFDGVSQYYGHWEATGCGKAVYSAAASGDRGLRVASGATIALTPSDKTLGLKDQAFIVKSGATLEVAASGKRTLTCKQLELANGAMLGFNFTDRYAAPVLALSGGNVVFTQEAPVEIAVKVSGSVWPKDGEYQLTTCGGFNADGVTVSLVPGAPKWVKGVSVNEEGDIVLTVKPKPTMIIVR